MLSLSAKVIKFISGGFDIYRTFCSATKRHAKVPRLKKEDKQNKEYILDQKKGDLFDKDGRWNVLGPHHDFLVIELYVSNHFL